VGFATAIATGAREGESAIRRCSYNRVGRLDVLGIEIQQPVDKTHAVLI
jgi:hypothetical protein